MIIIMRKQISQIARAIRLWWNVVFIFGCLRVLIAIQFPKRPKVPKIGTENCSSQKVDQTTKSASGHLPAMGRVVLEDAAAPQLWKISNYLHFYIQLTLSESVDSTESNTINF